MNTMMVKRILRVGVVRWNEAALTCKKLLVKARLAGDDEAAKELSQAKEFIKRRVNKRHCEVCGATLSNTNKKFPGSRCSLHRTHLLSERERLQNAKALSE